MLPVMWMARRFRTARSAGPACFPAPTPNALRWAMRLPLCACSPPASVQRPETLLASGPEGLPPRRCLGNCIGRAGCCGRRVGCRRRHRRRRHGEGLSRCNGRARCWHEHGGGRRWCWQRPRCGGHCCCCGRCCRLRVHNAAHHASWPAGAVRPRPRGREATIVAKQHDEVGLLHADRWAGILCRMRCHLSGRASS